MLSNTKIERFSFQRNYDAKVVREWKKKTACDIN